MELISGRAENFLFLELIKGVTDFGLVILVQTRGSIRGVQNFKVENRQ